MRPFTFANRATWMLLAALAAAVAGCSDDTEPQGIFPDANLAPTTEIVNPNLEGDNVSYNLLVSWRANDEDGTISGFEFAIDDTSAWTFTTEYDSQFVFRADACCTPDTTIPEGARDSVIIDSLYLSYHTLFVRAVDNEGARDPSPDFITFNSTTITPETVILRGPSPDSFRVTARTVILEWEGRDRDGVVVAYRYRLDDAPWTDVGADCTLVRLTNLTTSQFVGDTRGFHKFTVYAIDNAGAVERTLTEPENIRRWESVAEISGSLRIDSNVMGSRQGVNELEGQIFEGTRLFFDWRGDASLYGGIIQCYSHSYDDPSVFSACDIDNTHFPPGQPYYVPPRGGHTLFVKAFDDAGQTISANFEFVVLPGPGSIEPSERQVLYVDDFSTGTGSSAGSFPPDAMEEAFWDTLLTNFPVTKFDAEAGNDIPSARNIGQASTLIWYIDDQGSNLETSNQPDNFRNPIGPYVNAGGNLILCGNVPTDAFTPDNWFDEEEVLAPGCRHMPRNTYGGGDGSLLWYPAFCDTGLHFVYDFFKVEESFYRTASDYLRTLVSEGQPLPDGLGPLPDLTIEVGKRGVRADDGVPLFEIDGLEAVDQYELRTDSELIPLWRFKDYDTGELRRISAVYIPKSGTRGHILLLGFPPYFFNTVEMQEIFKRFLIMFGENYSAPAS
jgi:hypothetical protein